MVKQYESKIKLNRKPVKKSTKIRKSKKSYASINSSTSQLDFTIPDDNYLDAFDKFVVDGKR